MGFKLFGHNKKAPPETEGENGKTPPISLARMLERVCEFKVSSRTHS